MTEEPVRVLERFVSEHRRGFVVAAIRAVLEEIERLRDRNCALAGVEVQANTLAGGNERLKARIDAALNLLATRHTSNPQCSYCRELIAERAEIRKALRGEK